MSKHSAARSKAGLDTLSKADIDAYHRALKKQGAALLRHPALVRELTKKPKKIGQALAALVPTRDPHAQARMQAEAFYQKFFGLTVDFSKVVIPAQKDGFGRLVIVAQGVTLNQAVAACKKRFPVWQYYDDLDASVTHNDRTAQNRAYAVWFRDRIEADEETAAKSANQLKEAGTPGITLLERILMELEYFGRTGQHLDIQNITLCSGSRSSDGFVPFARWDGGEFCVLWYDPSYSSPCLRSRVAVS